MKKSILIIIISILAVNLYGKEKFYEAELHFKNGETKNGYAALLHGMPGKFVMFKPDLDAKESKIESTKLNKVVYRNNNKELVYVQLKIYKGWAQKKIIGPVWAELVKKGHASLYVTTTEVKSGAGFGGFIHSSTFHDYYCIRPGEAAAKIVSAVAAANNNQTFKAKASAYFEDYKELAQKIKKKEYKWRDLETVVDLYNEWMDNK